MSDFLIDTYGAADFIKSEEAEDHGRMSGLRSYVLELIDIEPQKEEVIDSVFLLYVNNIQAQYSQSVDRTYTLTNQIESYAGFRERFVTISGKSGDQYADLAKFSKLRNFINDVAYKKLKTENAFFNQKRYRLKLDMLWENETFEVTIVSFSYKREAGVNTNSYDYQLVLAFRQEYTVYSREKLENVAPPPPETPTAVGAEAQEETVPTSESAEEPPKEGETPPGGGGGGGTGTEPPGEYDDRPSLALKYIKWGSKYPDPFNFTENLYQIGEGREVEPGMVTGYNYKVPNPYYVDTYERSSKFAHLSERWFFWSSLITELERKKDALEITEPVNSTIGFSNAEKIAQLEKELKNAEYNKLDYECAVDPVTRQKVITARIFYLRSKKSLGGTLTPAEEGLLTGGGT
jgi:hypothetical protein